MPTAKTTFIGEHPSDEYKNIRTERRGRGWEKTISSLRRWSLLFFIFLLFTGATFDYYSSSTTPEIRKVLTDSIDGKKKEYVFLSFSFRHYFFRVLAIVFYTMGISVFITVFVSNKIERHERRKWESKIDVLRKDLAKSAFESLYNMIMPQELFDIVRSSVIENKVIRKFAKWDYRFNIDPGGKIVCERTFEYKLQNISKESVQNPVEFTIANDENSVSEIIHFLARNKDQTIAIYDKGIFKESKGLIITRDDTYTKLKLKGYIQPGLDNEISISCTDKTEYANTVQEVFFTKLPIINGRFCIEFPDDFRFFFLPSTASEFKLVDTLSDNKKIKKKYKFSGGVLPNQGFAFFLNRDVRFKNSYAQCLKTISGRIKHRLSNILSPVLGFSSLLLSSEKVDDSIKEKYISKIYNCGNKAKLFLKELEMFEEDNANDFEKVSLSVLLQDFSISQDYKKWLEDRDHISVDFKFPESVFDIYGNTEVIKDNILILLDYFYRRGNSKKRNITIMVKNEYIDEPLDCYDNVEIGEYVLITVKEDGFQIKNTDLNTCFEPFIGHLPNQSESGLEMARIYQNMQNHAGYCTVFANEDSTIFNLYYPIYRRFLIPNILSVPLESLKGNGEKVLIVDDEKNAREIASKLLKILDYKPYIARSGEEAISFFEKKESFDIVLLDLVMPRGIDGEATYEKIIQLNSKQKTIIISGKPIDSITEKVKKVLNLGAGEYIRKPFTVQELGEAIKKVLENT